MKTTLIYDEETLSLFYTQIALIYESGMDLREGLSFLESSKVVDLKKLMEDLKSSGKLSTAMHDNGHFPKEAILAMKTAEVIGQEASVATHLAIYYQRQAETKSFLKEVLIMPMMLITILILIMGVLSFAVIPVFQNVYESLGGSLDAWIETLLLLSKGIVVLALSFLILLLGWIMLNLIKSQFNKTPLDLTDKLLHLFPSRKYKADLARFSFIAQLVIKAGINQHEAMALALDQVSPGTLKDKLDAKAKELRPAQGLLDLIKNADLYPPLLQNTLTLAYKTGKIDEVMDHVSTKTREDSEKSLMVLLNRFEPILILTLTGFVALVLFSLILPLIGIMSSLG